VLYSTNANWDLRAAASGNDIDIEFYNGDPSDVFHTAVAWHAVEVLEE